jgi:uncharacterized protein YggE
MEERIFQMVIICLLVGALFVSLLFASPSEPQSISVSGSGIVSGSPDIVSVQIGISSSSPDPKTAVADIARRTQDVIESVRNASVVIVETSEYQIYRQDTSDPICAYQNCENRVGCGCQKTEVSYKATNWISATTPKLEDLGKIIDAAVRAGANEVQSIRYEFSDGKKAQVREEAIAKAIDDAKRQADVSLKGFNKSRGDIIQISINDGGFYGQEKYLAMDTDAVATPILPQDQKVSATAQCEFEII